MAQHAKMNNDIKTEFLKKYKLENYSRAVPAKKLAGKTVRNVAFFFTFYFCKV